MKLTVVSPEAENPRERLIVLEGLFACGLADYHVRKPGWGREEMTAFLRRMPAKFHRRLVLHSHHDLASEFAIGGLHDRDVSGGAVVPTTLLSVSHRTLLLSRAVHDLAMLRTVLDRYDRILVSPVFPSISKPGHGHVPRLNEAELRAILALPRRAEVFALGGVSVDRLPHCRELGFDGVAVLGAVWNGAGGPVLAFLELQQALSAHAA